MTDKITFYTIFYGVYLALFGGPIFGWLVLKKIQNKTRKRTYYQCAGLFFTVIAAWISGLSFPGVNVDVLILCATYLAVCALGFGVFELQPKIIGKSLGTALLVIAIIAPLLSIPAALGIAFWAGDMVPIYEKEIDGEHSCRVTSYGNATTSDGGYRAGLIWKPKLFPFVEKNVASLSVDNTRKPNVTPESVCSTLVETTH